MLRLLLRGLAMSGGRSGDGSGSGPPGDGPAGRPGDGPPNVNADTRAGISSGQTQSATSASTSRQRDRDGPPPATRMPVIPVVANATGQAALITKVSLNTATAMELCTFEQKYMHDESFQLLAYKQLKIFCETHADQQAIHLDLAMHPPLILPDRLAACRLDYPFLNRARRAGGAAANIRPPASRFHPVPGREASARKLSLTLIEHVVSPTVTTGQKELFLLKWSLDILSYYVDEQILRYREQGQADKANRLSDAEHLAVIQAKLTRMWRALWHPDYPHDSPGAGVARGLRQVSLILSIVSDTAGMDQRHALTRQMSEGDQLYADVLEIQRLYQNMYAPQERQKGARLKRILDTCNLSLLEQIASRRTTSAEARSFAIRLDLSGDFHAALVRQDKIYRELGSPAGYRKAAELRVAVERAWMLPRMRQLLLGMLEADPNLSRDLQVVRRNAARRDSAARLQAASGAGAGAGAGAGSGSGSGSPRRGGAGSVGTQPPTTSR